MGEYKVVSITNVSLAEDDWQKLICRLNDLDVFVQVSENKLACMSSKSTKKAVSSIDAGAITTEYKAFLLAINFYAGKHISGVCIGEME